MTGGLVRASRDGRDEGGERPDSNLFTSAFGDLGVDPSLLVPWLSRAAELGAASLASARGIELLQSLWSRDKYMGRLGAQAIERLEAFFDFAQVAAGRDIIRQDEYGNFMIALLARRLSLRLRVVGGRVSDRQHP